MYALFILFDESLAKKFPVFVGGFSGDTVLQRYDFDGAANLFVTGYSSDLQMVSTANAHFCMFMPGTSNTWLWTKEITALQGQDLRSLAVRGDLQRIALYYLSGILIVLDSSNGNFIRVLQESAPQIIKCDPSCEITYWGNQLYLFATSNTSPKNLLLITFNPDSQLIGPSLPALQEVSSNSLQFHGGFSAGQNEFFVSVHVGGTNSGILSIAQDINMYVRFFAKYMRTGATITAIKSLYGCDNWSDFFQTCFSYYQTLYVLHESSANEFYLSMHNTLSVGSCSLIHQVKVSYSAASSQRVIELRPFGDKHAYVMMQYNIGLSKKLLLLKIYREGAFGWDDCGCLLCGCTVTRFKEYQIPLLSSQIQVSNTITFSESNFFIGGYSPWHLFSVTVNAGSSQKVGFVLWTHPDANNLQSQLTITETTFTSLNDDTSGLSSSTISFGANPPLTTTVNDVPLTSISMYQWPTLSSPPNYAQVSATLAPVQQIYWFMNDPNTYPIPATIQPDGCHATCTSLIYSTVISTVPAGTTFTIDNPNSSMTYVFTSSAVTLNPPIQIQATGQPAVSGYANFLFQETVLEVVPLQPKIQMGTSPIPQIKYYIDDPELVTGNIPPQTYTNNVDGTYPSLVGDARLVIDYGLGLQTDGSIPPWVRSVDYNSRTISIEELDEALEGDYTFSFKPSFAYNPLATSSGHSFLVSLINKCRRTVIIPSTQNPSTFYYQIGEGPVDFSFFPWSHTYISLPDCGPFYYSISVCPLSIGAVSYYQDSSQNNYVRIDTSDETDHMTVVSDSTNYLTQLRGALYKTYSSDVFKVKDQVISFRVISTKQTYLIPPAVTDLVYVITDPKLIVDYGYFTVIDTGGLTYSSVILTDENEVTPDIELMTYYANTNPPQLIVGKSLNNTKIGEYLLKIRGKFNTRMPYYSDTAVFKLTVLHQCTKNIITGRAVEDQYYNISDVQTFMPFPEWKMSDNTCGEISFEMKLFGGARLPRFISPSSKPLGVNVFSMSAGDVGKYQIEVRGTTQYYNPASNNLVVFLMEVTCFTKKVRPRLDVMSGTVYSGSPLAQSFEFDEFDMWPICQSEDQKVSYSARLITGEPLPSNVKFNELQREIIVKDDGTMTSGEISIYISGKAMDSSSRSYALLNLKIESNKNIFGGDFTELSPVFLQVRPLISTKFVSPDMSLFNNEPYIVVKDDTSLKFIQSSLTAQELTLNPEIRDIGTHNVQIGTISGDQKLMQQVRIKVGFMKGTAEYDKYIEVTAKISKISRSGQVRIQFNQPMKPPSNITLINNETLNITVAPKINNIYDNLNRNFTWRTVSFIGGQTLNIELKFQDPFSISQIDEDILQIIVLDRTIFESQQGVLIGSRYKIAKGIPKQLEDSETSKYVDSLAVSLQDGIDALTSGSVVFNIIFGFIMSRLWGLINSMQIIVLMPLISVDFPANVQLVYYLINDNMNFQILPIDLKAYGVFDFNETEEQPFNSAFYDQGFTSLFMVQNINENFMNLAAVLFVTSLVKFLELISLHIEKKYKAVEFVKSIFLYNFLIQVLLENSLQFILFSVINNLQFQEMETPSKMFSYILSSFFLLLFTSMTTFNIVKVFRNSWFNNIYIRESHPAYSAMYELLKSTSKSALIYQSLFLIRRSMLALILVYFDASKNGQIISMTMLSLANMAYFARVQPFEKQLLNRLEMFNEGIILACYYHLLVFTGGLTDDIYLIYKVGWSMDMLLIVQFAVNIVILAYSFILTIKSFIVRFRNRKQFEIVRKAHEDSLVANRFNVKDMNMISIFNAFNGQGTLKQNNTAISQIRQLVPRSQQEVTEVNKHGMYQDDVRFNYNDFLPVTLDTKEVFASPPLGTLPGTPNHFLQSQSAFSNSHSPLRLDSSSLNTSTNLVVNNPLQKMIRGTAQYNQELIEGRKQIIEDRLNQRIEQIVKEDNKSSHFGRRIRKNSKQAKSTL